MTEENSGKKPAFLDPKSNLKGLVRIVAIVFILLVAVWLLIRFTAGEKAANKAASTLFQRPIEVKNAVENITASSIKAFPLSLPYTGTLTIEANVVKGNELDVYIVEESQVQNAINKKPFTHIARLEATKTKAYRRSKRLNSGSYFLVFVDSTLGILSASATDVQIKANLEP